MSHTHTHTHTHIYIYIAQSAGAVEYINECPDDTKQFDGEVAVLLGLLGNAEHPFIAIAPRSTLARNGSTW